MFVGPDITHAQPATPAPVPGAHGADNADAWHERQLAILSELAEAGLEIALALKTRLVATAAAEPDAESARACADLGRAFDRASRAVRMSIALRERLLKEGGLGAEAARAVAQQARTRRAERVQRIVRRVAKVRYSEAYARDGVERQARERLFDPDITGDLDARPIGALVAQICADLGLAPTWMAMAQEAWAQEEITGRPAGSPYAAWPDLAPDEPNRDLDDEFDDEDEDDWDDPGGSDP
ncbi:MAG: hypothetical protein JWP35_1416 [Caulobacter sp.]|nr:hypothetical protein [Caulobacter sp.]